MPGRPRTVEDASEWSVPLLSFLYFWQFAAILISLYPIIVIMAFEWSFMKPPDIRDIHWFLWVLLFGDVALLLSLAVEVNRFVNGTLSVEIFTKIAAVKCFYVVVLFWILFWREVSHLSNGGWDVGGFVLGTLFFLGPFVVALLWAAFLKMGDGREAEEETRPLLEDRS